MTAEKKNISFGLYLKNARLKKGVSLETISTEIKVGVDILQRIENEVYSGLPPEVFVKGLLRAYAKTVSVNPDMVIEWYTAGRKTHHTRAKVEKALNRSMTHYGLKLVGALGGLCCIMILSVIFLSPAGNTPGAASTHGKEMAVPYNEYAAGKGGRNYLTVETPLKETTVVWSLRVIATETTWIKVIIDNNDPQEYPLPKGENLSLTADSGFNILIGNLSAVQLFLNDKPVDITGKPGQAVNIQLP